jgi:hypothetical protein
MSVLGTLKSLFGFNEENQNDISSFEDAGMTLDEDPPKNTGATPTNDLDARAAQLAAVAANAEPGTYTDQNVINAQNTAGNAVIGVPPVNQTGVTNDGTTGTQTTGTQTTGGEIGVSNTRGGGTAPPPGATPGLVGGGGINLGAGSEFVRVMPGQVIETTDKKGVKSKSIEDLIEIGGSGFDDDVYARKLRRQAAMPDLKNEDYYPNQPFSESRTAWGDPIFSGAGAQFPMAAYDAQRKARAQAELDEAKSNIMQLKIPEIKTGAYIQRFRGDYTNEIVGAVNEAVKQAGGNRQIAMRNLKQSGKLAEIENKYNGIAKSIDQTADRAKDFLKNAQEKSTTMYFSPEGVRAATNFMNGAGAYADGLISGEDLNKLEQQFITADKWEKFKQENMGKLKPTDYIPTPEQLKNYTPEDQKVFEAVKLDLGDKAPDFNTWLYTQKYTEAALPQVMDGIVQPFFDQEKTAAEQLVLPGENVEDAKLRIARGIAALFGRQYSQGTVTENRKSDTNIIVNTGTTPSTETGVYYNTAMNNDKILDYISKNLNADNIDDVLSKASSIADATKSYKPDKDYFGFRIPAKWDAVNADVTPSAFSTYVIPDANNPSRLKTLTANDAIGATDAPTNLAPTSAKIKDIVYTYGVPDQSAPGGYRLITKADIKKTGVLPPNAEPVIVRHDELRYNMEDSERQGFTINYSMPKTGDESKTSKSAKDIRTKIAYKIFPATAETLRYYDDLASPSRKNESVPGSVPSGSGGGSSSGGWVK